MSTPSEGISDSDLDLSTPSEGHSRIHFGFANAIEQGRNRLTEHVVAACARPCSGRRPKRAPTIGEQRVEFIIAHGLVHAREDVGEVLGGLDAVGDA